MKKFLSLFNTFNLTMLTSLTIVACEDKDEATTANNSPAETEENSTTDEPNLEAQENIIESEIDDDDMQAFLDTQGVTDEEHSTANEPNLETSENSPANANKKDLSQLQTLSVNNLYVCTYKKYNDRNLNKAVVSKAAEFTTSPLVQGYQIKYYNAETGGTEITNTNQKAGTVWIEIIASNRNPNWKGQTAKRFAINFNKKSLSILTALTDKNNSLKTLSFNSTATQPYSNLNERVINGAYQFRNKPLFNGYQIKYYISQTSGVDISNTNQKLGSVWVEIITSNNDPNWQGKTKRFEIILSSKKNLRTITQLKTISNTELSFKANPAQLYTSLNEQILNSVSEFKNKQKLENGYQVLYYVKRTILIGNKPLGLNEKQAVGPVLVKIVASPTDPNWEGETIKFQFKLT